MKINKLNLEVGRNTKDRKWAEMRILANKETEALYKIAFVECPIKK